MRQLKITITNRDSPSLNKYMRDIYREDLLSFDEEVELAQRIRQGDQQAFEKLVRANLRFVVSVARLFQNQGLSLPDLLNAGNMGLIKAAEKFDETRGFKFVSYAVWWIRQSILQALAEQSRIVRPPLNQVGSLNKTNKAYSKFEQENERRPSADGEENSLLDALVNPDSPNADRGLINESLSREIDRTLLERESDIVKSFFGIGCQKMTLEEIGEKFGLTRESVRQIKERAIRRLRQGMRGN